MSQQEDKDKRSSMSRQDKARLIMAGGAIALIVVICFFSVLSRIRQNREQESSADKIQEAVLDYADNRQDEKITEKDEAGDKTDVSGTGTASGESMEQGRQDGAREETGEISGNRFVVGRRDEQDVSGQITVERDKDESVTENSYAGIEINAEVIQTQLAEIAGYWEAGNMEAVDDLARLPRFMAMSHRLKGTDGYYYCGEKSGDMPSGKGLAIYADNQYYYGGWDKGVRSGNGMWIKFFDPAAGTGIYLLHSYTGEWRNDLPNGQGAEHFDFDEDKLREKIGYNQNYIGNFKDGLYDGEIYITNCYSDGNVKEWSGTAVEGKWQPMGEKDKDGRYPVIVEKTDPDNYMWYFPVDMEDNGIGELTGK